MYLLTIHDRRGLEFGPAVGTLIGLEAKDHGLWNVGPLFEARGRFLHGINVSGGGDETVAIGIKKFRGGAPENGRPALTDGQGTPRSSTRSTASLERLTSDRGHSGGHYEAR
jgi:hypothetical protein